MLIQRLTWLAVPLVLCFGTLAQAQLGSIEEWQGGKASTSISEEGLSAVDEMMADYVDKGQVAGMVVTVDYRGDVVFHKALGTRGAEDERPLKDDDLFRIYSMTKPITGVAMMQLWEQGKFELDDPLSKHLPEFADLKVHNPDGMPTTPKRPVSMLHLMTHTAGFDYVFANNPVAQRIRSENLLGSKNLAEFGEKAGKIPLIHEPGTRWHYSIAVDVQGLAVERLSGKTFDVYLKEHIFDPLGMEDTFFSVPEGKFDRFLPNHNWSRQAERLMQMGQRSFDGYRDVTFFSGGGGLVSTAEDYRAFARAVANGGELDGVRILKADTVEEMRRNHLSDAIEAQGGTGENPEARTRRNRGFGFGLGFGVNTAPSTAERGRGEYSWGGAAGTVFWIDPVEDLVVVGLIQLMGSPWPLGNDLHKAVRGALVYESSIQN